MGGFREREDDDDDRGGRQDDGPSRADAADSWGGEKKFQPSSAGGGFGRLVIACRTRLVDLSTPAKQVQTWPADVCQFPTPTPLLTLASLPMQGQRQGQF